MIYFIDEDYRKLRALASELTTFHGFETKIIRDADSAFRELSDVNASDVDLVIIDVMLAVKADGKASRYSREDTDDFHQTGIALLDDLALVNPSVFPRKSVYFTHASSGDLVKAISTSANKHGIKMLKKKDYDTAYDFGKEIVAIIGKSNGGNQ